VEFCVRLIHFRKIQIKTEKKYNANLINKLWKRIKIHRTTMVLLVTLALLPTGNNIKGCNRIEKNTVLLLSTNIRISKLGMRWVGHAAHEKGMRTAYN
jgi:hypothetical protein